MKVYENKKTNFKTVAALGFFDGVHRGHSALIEKSRFIAGQTDAKSLVFTFNTHPAEIIGRSVKYITTNEEKLYLFEKTGIDCLYFQNADSDFMSQTAEEFFEHTIVNQLNAVHVIVGENYTFGKDKCGTAQVMADLCKSHGIGCDIIASVCSEKGNSISSSAVREAVFCGNMESATEMLGHRFFIKNTVERGRGDGRKMGIPTINTKVEPKKILPPLGVYATTTTIDSQKYKSITNIGYAPTFGENPITVETNVFDFDGDVYGKSPVVEFITKIRGEKKFSSPDELAKQIKKDINRRNKLEI